MRPVLDIQLGDVFRLRKPHPCGATDWRVQRTGADIRMVCLGCGHSVMLPRSTFERRVKALLSRDEPTAPGLAPAQEER
ncbi:MAG TPA: DUF951 domain-containing protein [Chloroflexia bacterium]|nr:DUF951 domain-containing protein [Chloroflexia bacterium]